MWMSSLTKPCLSQQDTLQKQSPVSAGFNSYAWFAVCIVCLASGHWKPVMVLLAIGLNERMACTSPWLMYACVNKHCKVHHMLVSQLLKSATYNITSLNIVPKWKYHQMTARLSVYHRHLRMLPQCHNECHAMTFHMSLISSFKASHLSMAAVAINGPMYAEYRKNVIL